MTNLEAIYNKYRSRVVAQGDYFRGYDKGQFRWFTLPFDQREKDSRTAETVIKVIEDRKSSHPPSVIDMACGIPYLWELLFEQYGVDKFVGVDLIDPVVMKSVIGTPKYQYEYVQQSVFHYLMRSNLPTYDIVISGSRKFIHPDTHLKHDTEFIDSLFPLVKKGGTIVYEYTKVKHL